jgi:hypothetical protein
MPFASVRLIGFSYLHTRWLYGTALAATIGAGLFAAFVNAVGAMHGAMYCNLDRFALGHIWLPSRVAVGDPFPFFHGWSADLFALPFPCDWVNAAICAAAFSGRYSQIE